MTVYVDDIVLFPTKISCFKKGSCHLTADTLEELHELAKKIGMKREWFQDHPLAPHYDLNAVRRVKAIKAGAIYKPAKEQAKERRAKRLGSCSKPACRGFSKRVNHPFCTICKTVCDRSVDQELADTWQQRT